MKYLKSISRYGKIVNGPWYYRLSVILILFLLSLPFFLITKLDIDNSPTIYFSNTDPVILSEDHAREYFPTDQVIILLFEGKEIFSDRFLQSFDHLAEQIREIDRIDNVLCITTQDHISGTADGFSITPVFEIDKLKEIKVLDRPKIMLSDRFARGALVSEDAKALSMVIVPKSTESSYQRLLLMDEIQKAIKNNGLQKNLTAVAGEVEIDIAQFKSMLRDNFIFIPSTTIVGLIMVWLLFRRILAVVVTALIIGSVVSFTISLYIIMGQPFTLIASLTSPLLAALSTASLVHIFNSIQYLSARGYTGTDRIQMAVKEIYRPILFTSLTTAAGLASLSASDIVPIAAFGILTSLGVILMFFLVVYIVPSILVRWDKSIWKQRTGGLAWMDKTVRVLTHIGVRYPLQVLVLCIVSIALGVPYIKDIKVETNIQEFFAKEHEVRKSTKHVDDVLVGSLPIEVIIRAKNVDDLKKPELLKEIKRFQDWAIKQEEIEKVTSLVDFIEEMNWGFNGENENLRKIPENPNLISQYIFIYDSDSLYKFVDRDFKVATINLNTNVHSARDIGKMLDKVNNYLTKNFSKKLSWEVVGAGKLFSEMERLLVKGQMYSLGGALVIIFVLMLILWRSFSHSLICMIPNLSPIVIIFIIMGFFGIWLDMATAMIASVAVGIAVDDTIHIFHGFIKRVKKGIDPTVSILKTNRMAGRAVMTTTIILTVQFMIAVTSEFLPTSNFGKLTGVGLIAALVFDLLFLPALLTLIYNKKQVVSKGVVVNNNYLR